MSQIDPALIRFAALLGQAAELIVAASAEVLSKASPEALAAAGVDVQPVEEAAKPAGCQHARLTNVTTGGSPVQVFLCRDCGERIEKPWPDEG